MSQTDEYYREARDRAYAAARALTRRRGFYSTPAGVRFCVDFRTPLRIYQLEVSRTLPGQDAATVFSFQRGGRVCLGGDRKQTFRETVAAGHEAWASRGELEEIAGQLAAAEPLNPAARTPARRGALIVAAAGSTGGAAVTLAQWAAAGVRPWWPALAAPVLVLAWAGWVVWRGRRAGRGSKRLEEKR